MHKIILSFARCAKIDTTERKKECRIMQNLRLLNYCFISIQKTFYEDDMMLFCYNLSTLSYTPEGFTEILYIWI
jgi:hypothetical protein